MSKKKWTPSEALTYDLLCILWLLLWGAFVDHSINFGIFAGTYVMTVGLLALMRITTISKT